MRKRDLIVRVSVEQLDVLEGLMNSSLEGSHLDVLGVLESSASHAPSWTVACAWA